VWEHGGVLKNFQWVLDVIYVEGVGRGANWFTFPVNSLDNLYAGALRQFITGRMDWSGLCIFIRPLMEGADRFMLMYFHLWSLSIRVGLLFDYRSDLLLECLGGASGLCVEVIVLYEVLQVCLILVCG